MKKDKTQKSQNNATSIEAVPMVEENIKPRFEFIFKKKNYMWMIIGLVVIGLGFTLMAGGGSEDPAIFDEAIFSWTRIRLAPMLVIAGFGIEMYAILLNPDKK